MTSVLGICRGVRVLASQMKTLSCRKLCYLGHMSTHLYCLTHLYVYITMPDAQRNALMPQTASQLLQKFLNQREVTRGLGFYEIWGALSSITLNNAYLKAGDVTEGSVIPSLLVKPLCWVENASQNERL